MTTDPLAALLRNALDRIGVQLSDYTGERFATAARYLRDAGVRVSEDAGLRMFSEADAPRSLVNLADEWVAKAEATGIAALNVRAFAVWVGLRSTPAAPQTQSPGEDGPAQPGAAATPGVHAVLAPFLVSPDHTLDGLTCWCRPYRDAEDPEVIIHQREARA